MYVHDLQREASAEAARDDAATVERDAERLHAGGLATALTVIDGQRTLAVAEQSFAQLKSAISMIRSRYFRLWAAVEKARRR
ncbi:hypothetical protein OKW49_001909 [Paraburkholderia youngii]